MSHPADEDPLIDCLLSLKRREDRGALAALRSGLGKRPGEAPRMFPYIGRFLKSSNPERPSVASAFLTAALFAKHPEHVPGRSLGLALWHATKREANPNGKHGEDGVEARFTAMIDSNEEDVARHLEGLISLCESASNGDGTVGLDWYQFRRDLISLMGDDDKRRERTFLRWARDFWQGDAHAAKTNSHEGTSK